MSDQIKSLDRLIQYCMNNHNSSIWVGEEVGRISIDSLAYDADKQLAMLRAYNECLQREKDEANGLLEETQKMIEEAETMTFLGVRGAVLKLKLAAHLAKGTG